VSSGKNPEALDRCNGAHADFSEEFPEPEPQAVNSTRLTTAPSSAVALREFTTLPGILPTALP